METIKASIKMKRLYTCSKCVRSDYGDTERHSISAPSTEVLKWRIDILPLRAHNMPIGWCSYVINGVLRFNCPRCKE